ncbi:MAG: hypothetical protein EXR21_08175 [Flavobacteriaceae bacterium]|nr:hypothetical protein [Flavobacteriaceae bacterium]
MTKRIAIAQSNYIPWKGYFDLINSVDEFVLYDDMQYTKRDWRNRNRIKTPRGMQWLTIPVEVKGKYLQKINETRVDENLWQEKHWKTIVANYKSAPYFDYCTAVFERLYQDSNYELLSEVNYTFIKAICGLLNITTKITWSSDYELTGERNERLAYICKQANADTYLSGPSAKTYMYEAVFEQRNIRVEWMDYEGYPAYSQLHPPFEHRVSVLDLLFHTGAEACKHMKSYNR